MARLAVHRFNSLKRNGGLFVLGVDGPRNGSHYFRLTKEDMARLLDEYLSIRGAPPRRELEASHQAAIAEMKQTLDIGMPIILLIAQYMGMSIEQAKSWWKQKLAEIEAERSALLREQIRTMPGPDSEWTELSQQVNQILEQSTPKQGPADLGLNHADYVPHRDRAEAGDE